jgi:DNA-binding NarL/FixJ family response regulator
VEAELLTLVRAGVEKFILKGASVAEFLKTIRALTDQENKYSHQLTRSVFTKILKEAVRKRNLRRSK